MALPKDVQQKGGVDEVPQLFRRCGRRRRRCRSSVVWKKGGGCRGCFVLLEEDGVTEVP